MPRRQKDEQTAMDRFEDEISAQLAGIPMATQFIRTKVLYLLELEPDLKEVLDSLLDELNDIEARTSAIRSAAHDYHLGRWGQGG